MRVQAEMGRMSEPAHAKCIFSVYTIFIAPNLCTCLINIIDVQSLMSLLINILSKALVAEVSLYKIAHVLNPLA